MKRSNKQKAISKKFTRAFTLVETLVAIAVLMIAIAGPLVIASRGLSAALYARDQMTASFLAQESIEVVKNIRDNNIEQSGGIAGAWILGLTECARDVNPTAACDASGFILGSPYYGKLQCASTGCPLYFSGSSYTPINVGGPPSIFTRYFYLTPVNATEYTITVIVRWNKGLTENELRLSSTITEALR